MPEWDAEVTDDEQLVRTLLSEQFPELDAGSARLLGTGFGAALLPGREPADVELVEQDRVELSAELARFLCALHQVELDIALPVIRSAGRTCRSS